MLQVDEMLNSVCVCLTVCLYLEPSAVTFVVIVVHRAAEAQAPGAGSRWRDEDAAMTVHVGDRAEQQGQTVQQAPCLSVHGLSSNGTNCKWRAATRNKSSVYLRQ